MFARDAWIDASRFEPLGSRQVLDEVLQRVGTGSGLVFFDLDGTLYDNRARTLAILVDWAAQHGAESHHARLSSVGTDAHFYGIDDLFRIAALSRQDAAHASAFAFWAERFFSNDLDRDVAYAGAAEFVHRLWAAGAEIRYLSARDEPSMGRGTRRMLTRDGFPMGERTRVLLKPSLEADDVVHKRETVARATREGAVVACFDNEPRDLVALSEGAPSAMAIFRKTVSSTHPARAADGFFVVDRFD